MPLGDQIRELDEQVASAVRRAVEDLREEVRRRLDEATSELQRRLGEVAPELPEHFVSEEHLRRIAEEAAAPAGEALDQARAEGRDRGRSDAHEGLRAALAEIDRAGGQAAVLEALLSATAAYAPRAAILLVRDGHLAGWGARGFEADGQAARSVALDAGEEPWGALVAGGGPETVAGARCAALVSQLESPLPREACALPLVLRDRVAAIVYADRSEDGDGLDLPALQVLTYAAALALETLAFRERPSTATLTAAAGAEPSIQEEAPAWREEPAWEEEPAWQEEPAESPAVAEAEAPAGEELDLEYEVEPAAAEAVEEAPVLPEEELLDLPEAPEVEAAPEAAPEVEAEEIEAAEPEPPAAEEESPYAPPHGDALLQPVEEEKPQDPSSGELDAGALEDTTFEEAPALEEPIPWETEPEEAEEEPAAAPVWGEPPPEEKPEEPEVAEPAELEGRPEAGDVPPPPPQPPTSGGPVAPPADVEGPGWAFSATREKVSKDEEAAHEEARRLARLLVSEIQLYNQDAVEEGRRNRDVYDRLKDDIDRSRQLYEERVDPEVRERTDYFYQELVRQLGAGDAKALGI